jgi:beta-galactosidase
VDKRKADNPGWKIVGTEETSGCGTRGWYFNDANYPGRMVSLNRTMEQNYENIIERGWKFYAERPWAAGLFYWTGFDYRGEPNPLSFPAHESEFGILDYCGFPKDEAYYLRAWWTEQPVLHIFPHWNLQGHEGEEVEVWAYSNCDEVELIVNGKKLGRQPMPRNGHLKWKTVYKPGKVVAYGYKNGKRTMTQVVETTLPPYQVVLKTDRRQLVADGRDVAVITAEVQDRKGRVVPDACPVLTFTLNGHGRILGVGNGDPMYLGADHPQEKDGKTIAIPAFNGLAQVLVQSGDTASALTLHAEGAELQGGSVGITTAAGR